MTQEKLLEAVQYGEFERVKAGLEQGLNPNYSEQDSEYSLINWAAQEGYTDIIKLLVQFGADVEGGSPEMPALYNAAGEGNLEVVATLIECGAGVNRGDKQRLGTALSNAAAWGHDAIVRLLIDKGANVNAFDDEGTTALWNALNNKNFAVSEFLRSHGARKRIIDLENLPEEVNLISTILNKYDETGYDSLNEQEKVIACISLFNLEVNSHGFEKVREALSAELIENIVAVLEYIGATQSANITQKAFALSSDATMKDKTLSKIRFKRENKWEEFGKLDSAFFDDGDNLSASLRSYMARNRAALPQF